MSTHHNYGETWEVAKSTAQLPPSQGLAIAPRLMGYFIMHYKLCIMNYTL